MVVEFTQYSSDQGSLDVALNNGFEAISELTRSASLLARANPGMRLPYSQLYDGVVALDQGYNALQEREMQEGLQGVQRAFVLAQDFTHHVPFEHEGHLPRAYLAKALQVLEEGTGTVNPARLWSKPIQNAAALFVRAPLEAKLAHLPRPISPQ